MARLKGTKRVRSERKFVKPVMYKKQKTVVSSNTPLTSSSAVVMRQPVFPRSWKRSLLYYDSPSIDPSVGGVVASYVFSANGMYDPNISGVGHQPLGFDQLMAAYDHYTVIGSKITVTFTNTDSSNSQLAGIFLTRNSATENDYVKIIENGKGNYVRLGTSGKDNATATLSLSAPIANFLGISKIMSEADLKGTDAANPAQECYFHIWAAPGVSVDSSVVRCDVLIEYIAVFTEPKLLAKS